MNNIPSERLIRLLKAMLLHIPHHFLKHLLITLRGVLPPLPTPIVRQPQILPLFYHPPKLQSIQNRIVSTRTRMVTPSMYRISHKIHLMLP